MYLSPFWRLTRRVGPLESSQSTASSRGGGRGVSGLPSPPENVLIPFSVGAVRLFETNSCSAAYIES